MFETHVTIKVHHTGIDEARLRDEAIQIAAELHDTLNEMEEHELVYVHEEHVTVHTSAFRVE